MSADKLNLHVEKTTIDNLESIVRNEKTGQVIVFRVKPEAMTRFLNLPHERLESAGREVWGLPNDDSFPFRSYKPASYR